MLQPVETGRVSRKVQVELALLKARLGHATHRFFGHVADDVWFLLKLSQTAMVRSLRGCATMWRRTTTGWQKLIVAQRR